jgi:hypothetical protein
MTTVVDVFLKEIRERIKTHSDHLNSGAAKDYAEYRDICGFIRGLETADAYLTDLLKKQEYIDDE